jgi:predicted nucleotidyltransferase
VRLTVEEQQVIREVVADTDPQAEVFLFGSRARDEDRGGDIDLLIMSQRIGPNERRKMKLRLMDGLGERKIDLVVAKDTEQPFVRIAQAEGVRL